ncbi:MAG: DUF6662 family protein [Akkermansiaceae bacterium]
MKQYLPNRRLKTNLNKALVLSTIAVSGLAQADENLWMYSRGTDTRPQGTWELKLSNITRSDKGSGQYTFNDFRPELEYGITDKLTFGAAILLFNHKYSVDDDTVDPTFETQGGADGKFSETNLGGFEFGLKYNILSPYKDAFGLSVGFAFEHRDYYRLDGAAIDQDSFVPKLYLQKNFLDDTLITTINAKVEFERRKAGNVLEEEIALDLSAGIAYRFAPNWFVGLEARYQSDYLSPQEDGEFEEGAQPSSFDLTDFTWGSQYQYGTYLGPSIHYGDEKWWITGSVLFQVQGGGNEGRNASISGGKSYDEHERVHYGVTVGWNF